MRVFSTLLLAAALCSACGKHILVAPAGSAAAVVAPRPEQRLTDHVILVSIDGLRPDAIRAFDAPTLGRLVAEGSYTLAAQTVLPSKTLPSHTSMLTGEPPDRHGGLWNNAYEDRPGTLTVPTVFSRARERGYRTAAFFSKAKFSHLQVPGTLDYSQAPGGWFGRWSAEDTVDDVSAYLAAHTPNLLFVHLTDPDAAGHAHGWMSPEYGRGVLRADAALGRLLRAADAAFGRRAYTLIVTADHGGHGFDHGTDHPDDVTIPWITWGRSVVPGEITGSAVRTMDTASTVLFLLGLPAPDTWAGVPITTAFLAAAND